MAYSFQTFSFNQVLTSGQMNQVEVNVRDHQHGVSGVATVPTAGYATGSVDQAAIGAAAVGQGELNTATASGFTSIPSGGTTIALTGGTFSLWTAGGAGSASNPIGFGQSDTAAGTLGLIINTGTQNFYRDERYVQASPPYALGPLFVFALLDAAGDIVSLEVGPDPTWAYHGPTDIRPQRRTRDGRAYRTAKTYDGKTWAEAKRDGALLRAVLAGDVVPVEAEVEITLGYKDSDIDVAPHPWFGAPPEYFAGRTVVLLEPGTALMDRLAGIASDAHARDVRDLIGGGYLAFDNVPIALPKQPVGVRVIRAGWKLTGG